MSKIVLKPKTNAETRSAIDWEAVRQQIEIAGQKLAASQEMSQTALEEAWARRAAQIAQKIREEEQGDVLKAAIVRLDGELYGLDVRHIFDIRNLDRVTFVPRAPSWVLGVVNWRGRILSVINFRRFLGLPTNDAVEEGKTTQRLVVVQVGEVEVGLRVDDVYLIETIPHSQIRKEEGDVRGIKPELVDGIFIRSGLEKTANLAKHNGEGIIVLLNLPALLADPKLIIREEIT